jgi:hypothetical protein
MRLQILESEIALALLRFFVVLAQEKQPMAAFLVKSGFDLLYQPLFMPSVS